MSKSIEFKKGSWLGLQPAGSPYRSFPVPKPLLDSSSCYNPGYLANSTIPAQAGWDPESPGPWPNACKQHWASPTISSSPGCLSLFTFSSEWGVAHSVCQLQAQWLCRGRWLGMLTDCSRHCASACSRVAMGIWPHTMACSWTNAVRSQRARPFHPHPHPLTEGSQTQLWTGQWLA